VLPRHRATRIPGPCSMRTGTACRAAAKARPANSATSCSPHRAGLRPCSLEPARMSWRTTLTIVLLVAAILTGWSVWRHRAPQAATESVGGRPDYLLHDLELVALDDEGKESFTLRAPLVARNPDQGNMEMQSPVFLLPDSEGLYWNVTARSGWVAADGKELRLLGHATATRPPPQ